MPFPRWPLPLIVDPFQRSPRGAGMLSAFNVAAIVRGAMPAA